MLFSIEKKVDGLEDVLRELQRYLMLRKEHLKLDLSEKLIVLLSALALWFVLILLGLVVVMYATLAMALFLGDLLGSNAAALGIVTALLLLLALTVYAKRQTWIVRPITTFVANLLLADSPHETPDHDTPHTVYPPHP